MMTGAAGAVRKVHHDALGIECLDHLVAKVAQARVTGLHRAIAHQIAPIVGQLDEAYSGPVEHVDAIQVFTYGRGFLEAVDEPYRAFSLGPCEVLACQNLREHLRMRDDLPIPLGDALQGQLVRCIVEPEGAFGCETQPDAREPGLAPIGQLQLIELAGGAVDPAQSAHGIDGDGVSVGRPA
jgi:hypothetical protein